jgi:hypothetical protein
MPNSAKPLSALLAAVFLGLSVGLALLVVPALLHGKIHSFLELIAALVEDGSLEQVVLLFAAGGTAWGLLLKPPNSFFAAAVQPGVLPIVAVIEVARDPTSHNLWPFEFAIYFAYSVVGVLGAAAGTFIRKTVRSIGNPQFD